MVSGLTFSAVEPPVTGGWDGCIIRDMNEPMDPEYFGKVNGWMDGMEG